MEEYASTLQQYQWGSPYTVVGHGFVEPAVPACVCNLTSQAGAWYTLESARKPPPAPVSSAMLLAEASAVAYKKI